MNHERRAALGHRATLLASALVLAASGCASHPPDSLAGLKAEQRLAVAKRCLREPERYGFPYTGEEYRGWHRDVGRWMPDLHVFCVTVGQRLVP